MDFDTAYARSGIGRSIYDPDWGQEDPEFDNPMSLDSLMDDEKENPVMDFDAHETDREYNVNRIRSLTEELDEVRRDRDWYRSRVDVLQLELDRHTRAEMGGVMAHVHIYSFCGQPGCKDRDYHPNTENLVSPPLTTTEVAGFFEDHADQPGIDPDTYVIRPCGEVCPNPGEQGWLYIRRDNPLTQVFRPNHYVAHLVTPQGTSWEKETWKD